MNIKYSDQLSRIIVYGKEEAVRLKNQQIMPEHLMLGLIRDGESRGVNLLKGKFQVNLDAVKDNIEKYLTSIADESLAPAADLLAFSEETNAIMRLCILETRVTRSDASSPEHLLLAMLKQNRSLASKILDDSGVNYAMMQKALSQRTQVTKNNIDFDEEDEEDTPPSSKGNNTSTAKKKDKPASNHPAIDNFGFDLTKAAAEGKLDPVVGREREIERLAQILSRRKKNNPVLIGEPGVGKSAIVEGLAIRIHERKVSPLLLDKHIIVLDMSCVVAGTKYRGQFEERMQNILNEMKANKDLIIFIDEIHTIVGAGNQSGAMDAANMLKPALARGEMQCIGATTLDEYRKHIEKDGALERRFQKIIVEQTTKEETLSILHNIKDRYEEHHNVTYTEEALNQCVNLTEKYVTDRCFPDKAIDILDEAGARVHVNSYTVPDDVKKLEEQLLEAQKAQENAVKSQNYELAANFRDRVRMLQNEVKECKARHAENDEQHRQTVDADIVAETVALMTGIPVQRMAQSEGVRLKGMRTELKNSIIAQDNAIDKTVSAIQRSRVGIKDPNRPIGVFMFLGPTGVGKTYLAKKLAEYMFGSVDSLIRIDMSEYMEKFTVSRLVGAPPGYVGYEEGGMLTEKVRRKPYSIVLLDEIEKAHTDVFNILLQVMDDGRLTDSNGRTIDFRNTVIIMTSNVGTRQLKEFGRGVGFASMSDMDDKQVSRSVIQKALNKQFSPEFLNRIDEIITFDQLDLDAILKIIRLELRGLITRMENLGYNIEVTNDACRWIGTKGYDKQFGARPLRRAIQQHIEDPITNMIVEEEITPGASIHVVLDGEKIVINLGH